MRNKRRHDRAWHEMAAALAGKDQMLSLLELESINFILPVGTHIDRAPSLGPAGASWNPFISTKQAIYSYSDVCKISGPPPWDSVQAIALGGPRFITFTITDDEWGLITCNWGSLILCRNDGKLICIYTPQQVEVIKNALWGYLWNVCQKKVHPNENPFK